MTAKELQVPPTEIEIAELLSVLQNFGLRGSIDIIRRLAFDRNRSRNALRRIANGGSVPGAHPDWLEDREMVLIAEEALDPVVVTKDKQP